MTIILLDNICIRYKIQNAEKDRVKSQSPLQETTLITLPGSSVELLHSQASTPYFLTSEITRVHRELSHSFFTEFHCMVRGYCIYRFSTDAMKYLEKSFHMGTAYLGEEFPELLMHF